EDSHGVIWAAGRRGLSRYADGHWERIDIKGGVAEHTIYGLYEDRRQQLWIATLARTFVLMPGQNTPQPLPTSDFIRAFSESSDGTFWVTTHDEAVARLNGSGSLRRVGNSK